MHKDQKRQEPSGPIEGDSPIRCPKGDRLGRAALAQSFAQKVLMLDRTEGVVVGVLGAWGSGKTSFVNLAREEFKQEEIPILDFNPWMFSGVEQLANQFFIEIATQLKLSPGLVQVGKALKDYGKMLPGWTGALTMLLGQSLQRRKGGINYRRDKVKEALRKLDKPILVILDDIDRLSTPEIRDIFRLVRLTANFPNIIYITIFDRIRVEDALTEQGTSGQDYLEKILQVAIDLPATPSHLLDKQILSIVKGALSDVEDIGALDDPMWPDVYAEIIRPLFRNMRDVRRYAIAIHGTVHNLKGQVALTDTLALEAVRVFLPRVFMRLHKTLISLTIVPHSEDEKNRLRGQVDLLVEAAGTHHQVARSIIRHLFPTARWFVEEPSCGRESRNEWIKKRRVAHDDILRFYLERVEGHSLQASRRAEGALTHLADRHALDEYLRSLDKERLQDVIASLEDYDDQFLPEHVIPGTIVLLNLLSYLPERPTELFIFDTQVTVTRVTYRLLLSLKQPSRIETAVRRILPELNSLSAKMALIDQIGYRENVGHKLISKHVSIEFEKTWRQEVRSASSDTLSKEYHLLKILSLAKFLSDPSEPHFDIDYSPKLTLALLRSARSDELSQTAGSRAVHRSPRLAWDPLVSLYGSEDTLRQRIESLKATQPKDANELFELADKYLSGWRPDASDK